MNFSKGMLREFHWNEIWLLGCSNILELETNGPSGLVWLKYHCSSHQMLSTILPGPNSTYTVVLLLLLIKPGIAQTVSNCLSEELLTRGLIKPILSIKTWWFPLRMRVLNAPTSYNYSAITLYPTRTRLTYRHAGRRGGNIFTPIWSSAPEVIKFLPSPLLQIFPSPLASSN